MCLCVPSVYLIYPNMSIIYLKPDQTSPEFDSNRYHRFNETYFPHTHQTWGVPTAKPHLNSLRRVEAHQLPLSKFGSGRLCYVELSGGDWW